jgi:hypothetical protein
MSCSTHNFQSPLHNILDILLVLLCIMEKNEVCCSVLQCVAVCSVLQSVAECCSVLQRVVVCCSVLLCVAVCCDWRQARSRREKNTNCSVNDRALGVAVCCSVLQYVVVCCSVLQCDNTHCVAVCCSVLRRCTHVERDYKSRPRRPATKRW